MSSSSQIPNIGEEYQGSVIVDIKSEKKDLGEKIRNRKYVTLKNGLMLVEDILEDKIKLQDIEGEYKEMPYNEVYFPDKSVMSPVDPNRAKEKKIKKIKSPKPLNLDDDEDEEEVESHAAAEEAEKMREQQRWKEQEDAKQARLEEARQLKLQAQQKRKEAEEEAARIKALEEEEAALLKKYMPQPIVAYSSMDTDAPPTDGGGARALWQVDSTETELYPDQDCWQPQDLLLYAPGKEPPPPQVPPQKQAPSVQGVWGYYPGSIPTDDDDDDDDFNHKQLVDGWRPKSDVMVYPPGVTPPTNVKTDGIYTYAAPSCTSEDYDENNQEALIWPPPIDKIKKMKKGLPNDFKQLQPLPVTVESASSSSKQPSPQEEEDIDAVWAYPKGSERTDDKYWKSQPLWLYPPGLNKADLPSSTASSPSQETATKTEERPPRRVQGIWGFAPGCEPDPDTGEWDKKSVLIYPPGTKPDDIDDDDSNKNFKSQGTWEYRTPDNDDDGYAATTAAMSFPPPYREPKDGHWEPQIATVYPTSKCPSSECYDDETDEWKPQGVWKYYDNPLKDKKWRPQELLIYTEGQEPKELLLEESSSSSSNPHGVWGLSPDAKPDKNGNWSPQDMWFYPPNEVPPSTNNYWKPQGLWTYPPQKLNVEERWPPPAVRNIDELGYKPKEVGDENWTKPTRCYVGQMKAIFEKMNDIDDKPEVIHPKGKSPLGVWKKSTTNDDDGKDNGHNNVPSWMGKAIVMYPPGEKPPTSDHDISNKNQRRGEWGLSPDAKPNDSTGEWDPSDIWFIGPDDTPPEEWVPGGIWTTVDEPKFRPKGADMDGENWKPHTATVVSSSESSPTAIGVWKFGSGDDDDDDNWKPSQVCMYPPGDEPDDDDDAGAKARGVWGLAPDAELDDDGEWNPSDVWFFGPNETPPNDDEWIKQGIWASDETKPKSSKQQFIPKGESSATDWTPQNVSVAGRSKKSDATAEPPVGSWKFGTGGIDDDDDDEWRPSQVCIYPPGHQPEDLEDVTAQGAWGLAPNAEPDEDGQYKPRDVWFFGLGETPDDDEWIPHGVWTTKEEKPKKKKKKSDIESPKKKKKSPKKKKAASLPTKKLDSPPKKQGSYLSKNWKDEQAQYGTIIRTSYSCNYGDDNMLSPAKVEKEKFKMVSPTRRSQQKKLDLEDT